jgi:hypothetical protein
MFTFVTVHNVTAIGQIIGRPTKSFEWKEQSRPNSQQENDKDNTKNARAV